MVMEQQDNGDGVGWGGAIIGVGWGGAIIGVGWGGAGIGVGSMEGLQGTLCGYMCI